MPELPTGNDQEETSVQSIPVPPTPETGKSSNEILCELFGAFNATPPPLDDLIPQDSQSAASERSNKKHKKHSKKKSKKVKKKKRSSSSESKSSHEVKKKQLCKRHKKESGKQSISESESVDSKKKKKKRKLGKFSASDTDSDEGESKSKKKKSDKEEKPSKRDKVKIKQEKEDDKGIKLKDSKSSTDNNSTQENILKHNVGKIVDKVIDSTNLATEISKSINSVKIESNLLEETAQLPLPIKQEPENVASEEKIPKDVDERQNPTKINSLGIDEPGKHPTVADVFAEDLIDCGIKKDEFKTAPEKSKPTTKKIMIQNLKFSQVYEATVKQIEEEAKLKAEKYEEGELSESTAEEERSPTPSEVSSSGSVEEVELEAPSEEKKRHRHHHKKQSHRHGSRRSSSKEKHRSHSHRERSPSQQSHSCRHRRQRKSRERGSRRGEERSRDQDSKEKVRNKDRDRSKDKGRNRDRERSKDREKARGKSKDRMRGDKHRHGHGSRSRSREREKRSPDEKIDKQKLLEIARKNALNMMKNPSGAPEQTKLAITSGGKTVNELTDFCKLLSKKDADGHESISSNTSHSSDSESEKPFHHPFQIKDRPSSIVLNIRVSPPHC